MTRMTGPDCAVICNLINTHTHIHTHYKKSREMFLGAKNMRNFGVPSRWLMSPTRGVSAVQYY